MQKRTIWSFVIFVAVYLTTMVLLFGNLYSAISLRKEVSQEREALLELTKTAAIVEGAESSARAFILSGDSSDLVGFESAKPGLAEGFASVIALTQGNSARAQNAIERAQLVEQEMADLTRIVALKKAASPHTTQEIVKHLKLPALAKSRSILSEMTATLSDSISAETRVLLNYADERIPLLAGSCFFVLLLLGVALSVLRKELKTRTNSMKELETSEERHRLTLEAGKMAVWEMNVKTGEGKWGGVAREIYGVDDISELSSREKSRLFIHEDDRAWVKAHFDQAVGIGSFGDIEFRIVRKDGQIRWLQGWAKLTKSFDGVPERMIGGVMDITDKRAARETIARHEKSILYASKMAALGEMAGGIAHEINNPLAIISGQAQLCLELMSTGEASPEQMTKSLQKIRQWVGRTATIIQGLRQFSRDGTHDPFHVSPVNEILEKTFELCRETFHRHGVKLEIAEPSSDLQIECRPVQISQILLNLLQNAMHAAEEGKNRWVRIAVGSTSNEVVFRITDSGPGVPVEIRDKIMQPFFTTKETGKGTGLGLSISKGLVDGHRGQIYLEPGSEHTCFVVKLPIYLNPEKPRPSPVTPKRPASSISV